MKFLTYFALTALAICGFFWYSDGPGSGMGYVCGAIAVGLLVLLLINKQRTGQWFSDDANGH